jgi:serine/threonine-protein kinase
VTGADGLGYYHWMLGETINGRFRLCDKLGEGGMAVVYRAEDLETHEEIALKVMKTSLSGTSKRRFAREFRAIASIDHPNCIKVFEFSETAEFPFFTMELFPGRPITTLIDSELSVLCAALYQAAGAIEHVHGTQIIHRDLKPSNLLTYREQTSGTPENSVTLKLADFGLARFQGSPSSLSVDSGFVGTLAYSAPEQISSGAIDYRCDLYSLGVICYELLTGRYPFEEARQSGMQALMRAHLAEIPLPIRSLNGNVPVEIDEMVQALLHKRAVKRPPSAALLKQVLAKHLGIDERTNSETATPTAYDLKW